jgi:hypothetical protein
MIAMRHSLPSVDHGRPSAVRIRTQISDRCNDAIRRRAPAAEETAWRRAQHRHLRSPNPLAATNPNLSNPPATLNRRG